MPLRVFVEPQLGATYDQLTAAAQTAESAGYGAFFRSDHVGKMGRQAGVPTITDAWTTLAGLARDTSAIRLGTLVTPVTFRHAGLFAVTAAQVDHMSGGRLEIGLGAGWYQKEHDRFALPFPGPGRRYDMLRDQLSVLCGAWSASAGARFEFAGATGSWSIAADEVRPLQEPRPPIILGGRGMSQSLALAVKFTDEYNVPFRSVHQTLEIHTRVRRACEAGGRDPRSMVYSAAQVIYCATDRKQLAKRADATGRDLSELRENGLAGTPEEVLDKLGAFTDTGVERFYLQFLDITDLDHMRLVAELVQPSAGGR